nr:PREDICTED: pollen-specific leucine-rich repeat extensin-like protein 1 [Bemisia tabaci]
MDFPASSLVPTAYDSDEEFFSIISTSFNEEWDKLAPQPSPAKPPPAAQPAPHVFKRPYLKPRRTRRKLQYCKPYLPIMKHWSSTYCPMCCHPEDRNKPFEPIPIRPVIPDPNFKPSFIPPLPIFVTQITELPPPSAPPSPIPQITPQLSYVFPLSPASIAAIPLPPSPPLALLSPPHALPSPPHALLPPPHALPSPPHALPTPPPALLSPPHALPSPPSEPISATVTPANSTPSVATTTDATLISPFKQVMDLLLQLDLPLPALSAEEEYDPESPAIEAYSPSNPGMCPPSHQNSVKPHMPRRKRKYIRPRGTRGGRNAKKAKLCK